MNVDKKHFADKAKKTDAITSVTWTYKWAWFDALHWYWTELRWSDDENDMPLAKRTAGNMWTPWLYLALDFRAATGLELARVGEKEEETKVTTMGRYFASASRCMALRCGTKLRKHIEEHLAVATMAPIGVKHVGGIKGRALLLRPQRVNTALYELGMSIKEGKHSANTLNSYIKMQISCGCFGRRACRT